MKAMDVKMAASSSAVLQDYLEKRANPGFITKMGNAFAIVFQFTLGRFVSKEKHHMLRFWSNKTWELWTSINKSYFYNSMMMMQLTRGNANPTLFGFTRIISLLITTPIYVTTYTWAKGRFGLRSAKAEFLYGFLYGIVTNSIHLFD